jgi:chromate transporter
MEDALVDRPSLRTIAREWTRLGCIGFGGPPAHVALLRRLCVEQRHWLSSHDFEDALAATNLLPGPASTQLAIFCAWRLRGRIGAIVGGVGFVVPGLIVIVALSALFLTGNPPLWVVGAAAGAGAAVPAVAVHAAVGLMPANWRRAGSGRAGRARWTLYAVLGAIVAATEGPYLVIVLALCGLTEVATVAAGRRPGPTVALVPTAVTATFATGSLAALVWVAFKVGALSYGGGFVIIPLMQHDAVSSYHWMTDAQFLNAVALGQITPGPVVQTIAVVGYAAAGVGGALLASLVAFAPSFAFVLIGGPRFGQLRTNRSVQAFLSGAGPAAIGAIAGVAIPLSRALSEWWQAGVLALAALWLLGLRQGTVACLVGAGLLGALVVLLGAPVPS